MRENLIPINSIFAHEFNQQFGKTVLPLAKGNTELGYTCMGGTGALPEGLILSRKLTRHTSPRKEELTKNRRC